MPWRNTTHDWAAHVDAGHLAEIRDDPTEFAPGGVTHLILEVIAYAADEAASTGTGRCIVRLYRDGSVSVADGGRGTDTRFDDQGRPVRKPIMATRDLRYFDHPDAERLPDGHPRRGMSVVAALSEWLIHLNRRDDSAWSQRYEHGLPVTDLLALDADGTTGTTLLFLPDPTLIPARPPSPAELARLSHAAWPHLVVEVHAEGGA
jgi:topoisomerase IV subunit B